MSTLSHVLPILRRIWRMNQPGFLWLFTISLGFSLTWSGLGWIQPAPAISAPTLLTQGRTIRIGHQKFDPLTLVKNRGNLEARLKPLGITNVQWREFASGPPMLEALNAGSIDIARTGDAPPVVAQAAGVPIVYIGGSAPKEKSSAVLVRKDSPIKSVADLKGKKVAFAKSSSANYFIIKVLETAGLNWNDIEPAYLSPSDARAAFERGSVDAWAIWDPFYAAAQAQTNARVLRTSQGLVANRDFFLSTKGFADQNADILRELRRETERVASWASRNPDQVAEQLSQDLKIEKSILEVVSRRRNWGFKPISEQMITEQQNLADTFVKIKLIPRSVRVADAIHPSALTANR